MRRIAITGISGYIGSQLLQRLTVHPEVEAVIGVDARPCLIDSPKLRFSLRDITQPLGGLFAKERVDTALHLAFVLRPMRRDNVTRTIDIQGTRHFLEECHAAKVGHVVYLGSTAAYGAHADNPVPLTEDSPLRPNPRFQYSRDKAETDRMFQEYASSLPKVGVTVLRGCVVMGPGGARSIGAKLFQPVMVRVAGHDPRVQYIHEDDLMELLVRVLERRAAGTYNIAGDGLLRYSDVARLARRPMVAVPKAILTGVMDATWRLRLQGQSTAAGMDFIAYPWVASNEKLKKAVGFSYRYSSEDTIKAYLKGRNG